jgi:hypothetical protein
MTSFDPSSLAAISASDVTNMVTILMCIAVLVQSVRMMRSLKAMRESALAEAAEALDRATAAANHVLGELKRTLKEDSRATAEALREGAALREELIVMVGIANSVAERLVDANGQASATIAAATPPAAPSTSVPPEQPAETDIFRDDDEAEIDLADLESAELIEDRKDDRTVALTSIMDFFR